jgi:hypothetical protein
MHGGGSPLSHVSDTLAALRMRSRRGGGLACLVQIETKLATRQYTSPQAFAADVELVWENCRTFNPLGDPFRTMGDKASNVWAKAWGQSGLANEGRMYMPPAQQQVMGVDTFNMPQQDLAGGRPHANKQPLVGGGHSWARAARMCQR